MFNPIPFLVLIFSSTSSTSSTSLYSVKPGTGGPGGWKQDLHLCVSYKRFVVSTGPRSQTPGKLPPNVHSGASRSLP